MKRNISTLLFCLLWFGSKMVYSQEATVNQWVLISEKGGVQVFGSEGPCAIEFAENPYRYLFLKVVNINSKNKTVQLNLRVHFEEGCSGCNEANESMIYLDLLPGESKVGTCNNPEEKLTRFIANPGFDGSWKYKFSEVIIYE